jgi:hypothetical protein
VLFPVALPSHPKDGLTIRRPNEVLALEVACLVFLRPQAPQPRVYPGVPKSGYTQCLGIFKRDMFGYGSVWKSHELRSDPETISTRIKIDEKLIRIDYTYSKQTRHETPGPVLSSNHSFEFIVNRSGIDQRSFFGSDRPAGLTSKQSHFESPFRFLVYPGLGNNTLWVHPKSALNGSLHLLCYRPIIRRATRT